MLVLFCFFLFFFVFFVCVCVHDFRVFWERYHVVHHSFCVIFFVVVCVAYDKKKKLKNKSQKKKALSCGSEHQSKYGDTGYENAAHFCTIGRIGIADDKDYY